MRHSARTTPASGQYVRYTGIDALERPECEAIAEPAAVSAPSGSHSYYVFSPISPSCRHSVRSCCATICRGSAGAATGPQDLADGQENQRTISPSTTNLSYKGPDHGRINGQFPGHLGRRVGGWDRSLA